MSEHPTILEQFRSFCFRNNAADFEGAVDYFAVFGGMGWNVDQSKPVETVIEEKILDNYKYIHGEITAITKSNPVYHRLLAALATGDRREHSAFRNTKIERTDGENAIDFLVECEILKVEKSLAPHEFKGDHFEDIAEKLLFINPFMRFWFSSISPYYKNIKGGDYSEFKERWNNTKHGFSNLIIERLLMEALKFRFIDDPLEQIGSYWNSSVEIDLFAKTKSGRQIAGVCKYSKSKAGKNDLKNLQDKCTKAGLNIDEFIVFSKNKFSNELKKQRSEKIELLSMRNLKFIMENLSQADLITSTFKKY
ncbi:MAG: ATPase [Deltaproteobacteria bacterium]|nr:ATPase [Deltaproteobacteria bacterium]